MRSYNPKSKFKIAFISIITLSVVTSFFVFINSRLNILPAILETRNYIKPKRTCGTFAEDFTNNASRGELIIKDNKSFSFIYTKSKREGHAFTGAWFPLEALAIDFSSYDIIEVEITTNKARRIPLNLSVQNNITTHQYVHQFIDIDPNRFFYELRLDEFYTPSEWYEANNVSQSEIPIQDFAKVEAISFESCRLLDYEIRDEFTVNSLVLKKDLTVFFIVIIIFTGLIIVVFWIFIFKPFGKKEEVVHVPIKEIEYNPETLGDKALAYLAKNYSNPDLTLEVLKIQLGKGKAEISNAIKNDSKLTFPRYLNYLRIDEAKRILKQGDFKTISEVGFLVGFNSSSNFIRVFKSQEGVSPKKFVEQA